MNRFVSIQTTAAIHTVFFLLLLIPNPGRAQLTHTFLGHTLDVLAVAFSPDGKYLASGSGDRTIHLWDVRQGTLVRTYSGHTNGIRSVTFSPDGKYIASGSRDKTVRLWSSANENLLRTFSGHTEQVFSVVFSPDGKYLASGSDDNSVQVWDAQTGLALKAFRHINRVFSVAFSPDGLYVASGSEDKTVRLWNIQEGSLVRTFSGHTNSVISIAFSPDGRWLASGSSDNSIWLWNVQNGEPVKRLYGHTDLVSSVAFSPDSKHLASSSFDSSVRIWDVSSGSLVKTLFGHVGSVLAVAFSPDGVQVASGGEDKAVLLWDIGDFISSKSDPRLPPLLLVAENSILFRDADGNGRLDAGELATVEFIISNKGKGIARGLKVVSQLTGMTQDVTVISPPIPAIEAGESQTITTILKGGLNVQSGKALLKITVTEPNGLDSEPVEVEFNTLAFQPPDVVAADGIFTSQAGGNLKANYPANLEVLVQNTGAGSAQEIAVEVQLPENVLSLDPVYLPIARLGQGESIRLNSSFIVTARYYNQEVPIHIIIREKYGKYGSQKTFTAHLDQPLATTRVSVQGEVFKNPTVTMASLHSEVDRNIPLHAGQHANRFALVIGNEDYQRFQTDLQFEQNVVFARNDAVVFKEYLVRTLGFPENQVFLLTDATRGQMGREVERLVELAKITPHAELVFYYAGHGLPDEQTRQGYIIPVDVTASSLKEGILLNDLYKKLAASKADRVTVFLDACFSGGGRGENGLLAARTVKVKPKGDIVNGNVVVFTAATGEEVSLPLLKESHGLFTYCLLHKLKETEGNVTLDELRDYLQKEMPKLSLLENSLKQTPQVLVAPDLGTQWQTWRWQ